MPTDAADRAVAHLLRRISRDPRLAYHFDPLTESFRLLTDAYAEARGLDADKFRKEFAATIKFEAPVSAPSDGAS